MSDTNKYLDLNGLSHYNDKINKVFVNKKDKIIEKEIADLFDGIINEEGEIINNFTANDAGIENNTLTLINNNNSVTTVELDNVMISDEDLLSYLGLEV